MNVINIYCEFEFLKKFYAPVPEREKSVSPGKSQDEKYLIELDTLLCRRNCGIFLNIDKNTFNSFINDTSYLGIALSGLLSAHADGHTMMQFSQKKESLLSKCSTIFLLGESEDQCKRWQEKHGLFFISSENYLEPAQFLFSPYIKPITKRITNWDFLRKYRHPCNSITLIDPYLLSVEFYRINNLKTNIKTLFDALLPEKFQNGSFSVKIYTRREESDTNRYNYEKNQQIIKDTIKNIRRYSYSIDVSFPDTQEKLHDRYLLTNYCLFSCGYGFLLNPSRRETVTILTVWPLTSSSDLIQTLKDKFA
ncbi:MAG: hypothetical protein LBR10_05870 [Prevotellaceae bacterium]|jgi:hypothetical protein|nr:hypothetical protein [Prevotellaceae bacterium]